MKRLCTYLCTGSWILHSPCRGLLAQSLSPRIWTQPCKDKKDAVDYIDPSCWHFENDKPKWRDPAYRSSRSPSDNLESRRCGVWHLACDCYNESMITLGGECEPAKVSGLSQHIPTCHYCTHLGRQRKLFMPRWLKLLLSDHNRPAYNAR